MKGNEKRIAVNTIFMYLRLLITIPLAFYTSRVVIQQLGVDDFGIYQAVAGIITMFAILRSAFDSATQRYYNAAMAKDDNLLLSQTFYTSLLIHIILTIILIAVIEVFGLWFIKNKMQYPAGSETDVYFVFHVTVISIIFIVMNIPFSGMVIAKEHMKFYAYTSILDVCLKLVLVMLLVFVIGNKLKIYALFQMSIPLSILIISILYFLHNFKTIKIARLNITLFKEMTIFSGWGFMGSIGYSLVNEGVNLLLNVFGGVAANAARGIAFQVRTAVSNVLTSTMLPVRPQTTQMYIRGEKEKFWEIIYLYSKVLFLLASLMVIPIIVYSRQIINLWLGQEPMYSIVFMQIIMLYTLIRSLHEPIDIAFKASGRMKQYQLTAVCISSLTFFISWFLLKKGGSIYTPFIVYCIIETILLISLVLLARKEGIVVSKYLRFVIVPCCLYSIIGMSGCLAINKIINPWFISAPCCLLLLVSISYGIVLTHHERTLVKSRISSFLNRF
ncbi:MAG: oligosaccharide flippase family protein [Muribaculum sp.]|nr:oligosaccharide flippase family protein [Muribaculum sp.]